MKIEFELNGRTRSEEVPGMTRLLDLLRDCHDALEDPGDVAEIKNVVEFGWGREELGFGLLVEFHRLTRPADETSTLKTTCNSQENERKAFKASLSDKEKGVSFRL